MKLNLRYDSRLKVPDGTVLVPGMQRITNKLKEGSFLEVTGESGRKVKLKVQSSPNTNSYVSRKTLYTLYKQKKLDVTLGCDPEFALIDKNGNMCRANEVLKSTKSQIGNDGSLGEFRPSPGKNEVEVVENLRELIYKLNGMIDNRFTVPGVLHAEGHSEIKNRALGFHIHVGAPRQLTTKSSLGSVAFLNSFATALDFFVGIPGMLLEQSDVRRLGVVSKGPSYGKAGDWRTSRFGTIEYRTPGGFHLRHPEYARGIMALAQCASKDILNYMEGLSCGWAYLGPVSGFEVIQDRYGLPDKSDILDAFNSKTKDKALYMLEGVINVVSQLDSYEEHKDSIETFLKLVINNKIYSPKLMDNW